MRGLFGGCRCGLFMRGLDDLREGRPGSCPQLLDEFKGKQVSGAFVAVDIARHEDEVQAHQRTHEREGIPATSSIKTGSA